MPEQGIFSALKGSFLGAVLFGYPFEDLGVPDLLLLALLGFVLVWRFMPGPRSHKNQEGDRFTVGRRDSSSTELPSELQPQDLRDAPAVGAPAVDGQSPFTDGDSKDESSSRTDGDSNSAAAPEKLPGASLSGAFDPDDFLEGARVLYIRMQEAWAGRDTERLAPFMTPDMMSLLREQAAADPHPVGMHIMLLAATLVDVQKRDNGELAVVEFSVLMRTDRDAPFEVREIWHFVRGRESGNTWRLAGIEEHEERQ